MDITKRGRKLKKVWAAVAVSAFLFCGNTWASVQIPFDGLISQEEKSLAEADNRNTYREDYYGAQLSESERMVYDALYEQYYVRRDTGAASLRFQPEGYQDLGQEDQKKMISNLVFAATTAFLTDYQAPLSDGYRWECKSQGDIVNLTCHMEELYPGALAEYGAAREEMGRYKAQLDEKLADQFGEEGKKDRYAILLTIHDSLIDRITYSYSCDRLNRDEESDDYDNNRIGNTLAGVALDQYNHYGVCQGYMAAVKELCDLYQIPCVRVDKKQRPGEKAGHSWVYVQLEDNMWYTLDVTLDDLEDGEKKKTSYRHFLTGIAELDAEHIPYIPLQEYGKERKAIVPRLAQKAAPYIDLYLEQKIR